MSLWSCFHEVRIASADLALPLLLSLLLAESLLPLLRLRPLLLCATRFPGSLEARSSTIHADHRTSPLHRLRLSSSPPSFTLLLSLPPLPLPPLPLPLPLCLLSSCPRFQRGSSLSPRHRPHHRRHPRCPPSTPPSSPPSSLCPLPFASSLSFAFSLPSRLTDVLLNSWLLPRDHGRSSRQRAWTMR